MKRSTWTSLARFVTLGSIVGVAAISCSDNNNEEEMRNFLLGLTDVNPIPEDVQEIAGAKSGKCYPVKHSGKQNYQDLVTFDTTSGVIFPGALIQGGKLQESGLLAPVQAKRRPFLISLNNVAITNSKPDDGDKDKYSIEVQPASSGTNQGIIGNGEVKNAVDQLFSNAGKAEFAGNTAFKSTLLASKDQSSFHLGFDVKWSGNEVKGMFDKATSSEENSLILSFTQAYYTISADPPASPEKVFDPSVSVADINPYASSANKPRYVASVTYGRRLLVKLTSKFSMADMKAYASAKINYGGAEVSADAGFNITNSETQIDISVLAQGGDPKLIGAVNAAAAEVTLDKSSSTKRNNLNDAIKEYMEKGSNYTPLNVPVPLSYRVIRLSDNTPVAFQSTLDFTTVECGSLRELSVKNVEVIKKGDKKGEGEISLQAWIVAIPKNPNGTFGPVPHDTIGPDVYGRTYVDYSKPAKDVIVAEMPKFYFFSGETGPEGREMNYRVLVDGEAINAINNDPDRTFYVYMTAAESGEYLTHGEGPFYLNEAESPIVELNNVQNGVTDSNDDALSLKVKMGSAIKP